MYIADDMGLGKTIQALATAAAFKEEWPLLVVCPSSMRFAWKDAALRWIPGLDPEDVTVITSGKDYLCNGQMLVISYDLLSRKESELLKKEYKVGFHIWRPPSSLWTKNVDFADVICRARQNGLRAAHFGDTVLPVPKKSPKKGRKSPKNSILAIFGPFLAIFFRYWQHCVAEVSRAQSVLPSPT